MTKAYNKMDSTLIQATLKIAAGGKNNLASDACLDYLIRRVLGRYLEVHDRDDMSDAAKEKEILKACEYVANALLGKDPEFVATNGTWFQPGGIDRHLAKWNGGDLEKTPMARVIHSLVVMIREFQDLLASIQDPEGIKVAGQTFVQNWVQLLQGMSPADTI